MSALLTAVQDRLIGRLNYIKHKDIDVVPPPGRPTAMAGEKFVSIWGRKTTRRQVRGLDERYEVRITVSMRGGQVPWDRWGNGLWLRAASGLEEVVRPIVAEIHGAGENGIALLNAANALLLNQTDRFLSGVPLLFQAEIGPEPKAPRWWGATSDSGDSWAGISSTLVFAEAQRIQLIDNVQ
jgi:hypothetical protein